MSSPLIRANQFEGSIPRTDSRLIGEYQAQLAQNCHLQNGTLAAAATTQDSGFAVPVGSKTIYKYDGKGPNAGMGNVFAWPYAVDVIEAPVANDAHDRIYAAGNGYAEVIGKASTPVPSRFKLGVPRPVNKPDVKLVARAETTSNWTRQWFGAYEGFFGTQISDQRSLSEGTTVEVVTPGVTYKIRPWAKTGGIQSIITDRFSVWFEGFNAGGDRLGVCYSDRSYRTEQNDLIVDNNRVSTVQTTGTDGNGAFVQIDITYTPISAAEANTIESKAYVYTYVTAFGEESAPSPASVVIDVPTDKYVQVTGFKTDMPQNRNITKVRLYRTLTGSTSNAEFQFVTDIDVTDPESDPNPVGSFNDTVLNSQLGEILPSDDWDAPPEDMDGIVIHPGGFAVGFAGNEIQPSVAYLPHAYPVRYRRSVPAKVVGLAVFENSIVVCTEGKPYLFVGYSPDTLSPTEVHENYPCVSRRSIVNMGSYGVGYASSDGFALVTGATASLVTDQLYDVFQWRALNPAGMHAKFYNNALYIFHDNGTIVIDFLETARRHVTFDRIIDAGFTYAKNDRLMVTLAGQGEVRYWNNGGGDETYRWRSRKYLFNRKVDFAVGLVHSAGQVTLKLYRDDQLAYSRLVANSEVFRLPTVPMCQTWAFELEGTARVYAVTLARSVARLLEAAAA